MTSEHIKLQRWITAQGEWLGTKGDWNFDMTPAELINRVMTAIHNISMFYDQALAYGPAHGISEAQVKAVTANCRALQIIRDLDNADKHPGAKGTTGLDPQLKNVAQSPWLPQDGSGRIEINMLTGETKFDKAKVVIHGEVTNGRTGAPVTDLPTLLDEALAAWEAFLRQHQLKP
jgi:hypothetical protein